MTLRLDHRRSIAAAERHRPRKGHAIAVRENGVLGDPFAQIVRDARAVAKGDIDLAPWKCETTLDFDQARTGLLP